MVEHNHIVCSNGKVTRLLSSLEGIDTEVKIMPSYAIREEMMNKSALLRTKFEELNKDSNKESLSEDEYDKKFKEYLRTELKNDYVNTGILNEDKFKQETDWIEML